MITTRFLSSGLAVVATFALALPSTLNAQCGGCKSKPGAETAKTATKKAGKTTQKQDKKALAATALFNSVCPVTGKPTNAKSSTVLHDGYKISLCCPGCSGLFAKLDDKTKTAFLAKFTGKNQKKGFVAVELPTSRKSGKASTPACGMACGMGEAKAGAKKPECGDCEMGKTKAGAKKPQGDGSHCEMGKTKTKAGAKKPQGDGSHCEMGKGEDCGVDCEVAVVKVKCDDKKECVIKCDGKECEKPPVKKKSCCESKK